VANGRLPALARLSLGCEKGLVGGEGEGVGRLARAFEALAGTLKSLSVTMYGTGDSPAGACYELGAAIGKLRRLKYMTLKVSPDGRNYAAVARGLAASGGCPELFALQLWGIQCNIDWLIAKPSLLALPSVRSLYIDRFGNKDEALLLCCGLVQAGFRNCLQMANMSVFGPHGLNAFRSFPTKGVRTCRGCLQNGL
jgi:hypothetical protein